MSAVANPLFAPDAGAWPCPFQHVSQELCLASTSCDGEPGFVTSRRCGTEGHETCPLYLAKVLRGLRPPPRHRWGELRTK